MTSRTVTRTINKEPQAGQRATVPGARPYTTNVPTSADAPQDAHVPVARVISSPKTSASRPAMALPSSAVTAFPKGRTARF